MSLILGGALLAVGLLVVLVSVLQGGPDLTFNGRPLARPDDTLIRAERHLQQLVEERHGAAGDDTRCYFSLREGQDSDVRDHLRCGPVLFVDGDPDEPYLTYRLEAEQGRAERVRLVAAEQPQGPNPERVPADEDLRRPDGKSPPDGSGDLRPPPPQRAEPRVIEALPAGALELDGAPPEARIGGLRIGYRVAGLGEVERFGRDDAARRPARGERFVAAEIEIGPGELGGLAAPAIDVRIQVGDDDPVPAPEELREPYSSLMLVVSVPRGTERVDLLVADAGVEQRLDLLEGTPASGNAAVLRRENRQQDLNATANLTFTARVPGYVAEDFTITPTVDAARLFWHFPVDGSEPTRHPAPDRAYLVPVVDFAWDSRLGGSDTDDGLPPAFFSLRLPDGQVVPAVDVDQNPNDQWVVVGFDVAADFTVGTLVIGGTAAYNDITFDFGANRLEVPLGIPAG